MRNLVIAATALAFTSAAHAADMPLLKAAPMAPPDWTGFYIGVNGGFEAGRTDTGSIVGPGQGPGGFYVPVSTGTNAGPAAANGNMPVNILQIQAASANSFNTTGGMFGGQVGYLVQAGTIVGGLELGFDWMGAKGSATAGNTYTNFGLTGAGAAALAPFNGVPYAFNQHISSDWLFTFLARVGFDMGAWYPYVTAGLAVADLKYSNNFADANVITGPGVMAFNTNQVRIGPAAGAGIEWRWDNHWSLRGEYLFTSFGDVNGFAPVGNPATPAVFTVLSQKATFWENIGRVALSYKW